MPPTRTPAQTRKPREKKPYAVKPGPKADKPKVTAKTSAIIAPSQTRENLTLSDWLLVLKYVDEHQDVPQSKVVEFFRNRREGALVFSQSALSRKLRQKDELLARVDSNPTALSSKRPRIVTRPDVERALVLWTRHMHAKKETYSGHMLVLKRRKFEAELNVPMNERLTGDSWVQSFLRTYKIKEIRRHGEAASVDLAAVARERERLAEILVDYAVKDRWNFDETGLYAFAPPDRGLAIEQMSGKKQEKFRITLGFACNADGSEKRKPIIIGKSAMPRCFKKVSPRARGFYYRNNKKAWMTAELFEEYVKKMDLDMRSQGRHVILLIDNFTGHFIAYQPTNIRIEFFEPNMTSFVQPLDAGIIRCFKAHYRRAFCLRAIDLDDAGERDIYKIDLLEAMMMVLDAWNEVLPETMKNCWKHTGIQGARYGTQATVSQTVNISEATSNSSDAMTPLQDQTCWKFIRAFADGTLTMPETERRLKTHLDNRYIYSDWKPMFDIVFRHEEDSISARNAIEELYARTLESSTTKGSSVQHSSAQQIKPIQDTQRRSTPAQLSEAERDLLSTVNELQKRRRIIGTAPTLEDLLNPVQEQEIGDSPFIFEGGDQEIVEKVRNDLDVEQGRAVARKEADSEEEEEEEEGNDETKQASLREIVDLCSKLEQFCLSDVISSHASSGTGGLALPQMLRKLRGQLHRKISEGQKQADLHAFWPQRQTTTDCP